MTVTKDQSLTAREFHTNRCARHLGPRGGITVERTVYRRNGMTKTWVTRPDEFRVPVKRGMYEYGYIDQGNADMFHVREECPIAE